MGGQKFYQKYVLDICDTFWGEICGLFVIIRCYFRVKRFLEFSSIPREEFHFFPRSSRGIENRGKYDMYYRAQMIVNLWRIVDTLSNFYIGYYPSDSQMLNNL